MAQKKSASTPTKRRISIPKQDFKFGSDVNLFPEDRPIIGSDILKFKTNTAFDLNKVEASLGISRRDAYYDLKDKRPDEPLPEISMSILLRLYARYPELLPFQPVSWAEFLTAIGVHPSEFAQLVGRTFSAGRSWLKGEGEPIKPVQLIIEALARAGVTNTNDEVYQEFLKIAHKEADLRGEKIGQKKAPTLQRKRRRTTALKNAEASLMTKVDD